MNSTSLNEIAYNILNTIRGGRSSNTEVISLDQIKYAIKYYRTTFIRRDQFRNANRYRQFEQDLGFLSVSEVDTAESDSEDSYKFLYRTDKQIPSPVRLKRSEAITFVGGLDKAGKPIPVVDAHRNYWNQFSKYTSRSPEAYYRNGYIYLDNTNYMEKINVRGIFEDPEEVFEFAQKEDGTDLYTGEEPFPIPQDMIEGITKGLINGELSIMVQSPTDEEADMNQSPRAGGE